MTYNIHPLLVHFPIALLFLYSIIKVLPMKKWLPNVAWKDIERVLLLVGVLGAFAALATGDTAKHLTHPNHQLVNAHANFAVLATFLYGALLVGEIAAIINRHPDFFGEKWKFLLTISQFVERVLCNEIFSKILAVLALIAIFVAGLLGGAIVYGVTADPLAPFVIKLLGITV